MVIELKLKLNYMPTEVRIDEKTKSHLEELQAEIRLRTGEKVTQQEILARLVRSAVTSRSEFVDTFREGKATLTDEEMMQFNQGQISSGLETDEDDIDEILYG